MRSFITLSLLSADTDIRTVRMIMIKVMLMKTFIYSASNLTIMSDDIFHFSKSNRHDIVVLRV